MSHHFDGATAMADKRLDLCDVAVGPWFSVLVLTVNPEAGCSTPLTFRPDADYQFAVTQRNPSC